MKRYSAEALIKEFTELADLIGGFHAGRVDKPGTDTSITPHETDDPDAVVELRDLLDELSDAVEGTRNDTLNRIAFRAYGLWKAGRLAKDCVTGELLDVAIDIGLSEDEALTTMRSARRGSVRVPNVLDGMPELEPEAEPVDVEELIGGVATGSAPRDPVELVNALDLPMVAPRWLWHDWIMQSALNILAGAPSDGKTTLAMQIVAIATTGGAWPNGTRCETPVNVLIWTGEDDPQMTLIPRLVKAGADLRRVHFIRATTVKENGKKIKRSFDPGADMPALRLSAKRIPGGVGMLVLDPVVSAVTGDSHKNTEVRRGLQPVVDFAQEIGAAVLGITHFGKNGAGKNPMDRILGSQAFAAVARIVLCTVRDQDDEGNTVRTLVRGKNNLGADGDGYRYTLHIGHIPDYAAMVSSVHWGQFVEGTAKDIINEADQDEEERDSVRDAVRLLQDYLADGPRDMQLIQAEAKRQGLSVGMLKRAKKRLKVESRRINSGARGSGRWEWYLKDIDTIT